MTVNGRFFVTPHAIQRYIERVHRGISYDRALSEIIEASETAHFVKHYVDGEWNDAEYWRCSRTFGRLRLIVSRRGGELAQIRTILPACEKGRTC